MPSLSRAALALSLAMALSSPAHLPAQAEKGGKPEKGEHGPGHGKHDKDGNKGNGGGKSSGGSADLLQAGVTAAAVAGLLGPSASQVLSVGAKPLAPGIVKNIARGKKLPPGIGKQAVPATLLPRLPRVDGHEWVRIGTELVLVAVATQVVAQVIADVFS